MTRYFAVVLLIAGVFGGGVAEARRTRRSSHKSSRASSTSATSSDASNSAAATTEDQKRVAAQRLVKEARGFYDKKQFQPAIEKFEEAWKLFPVPKMLYNLAVTYESLHRDNRAACAFEHFLSDAPDADPGLRDDAKVRLDKLALGLGHVRVEAPSGTALFVDGEERATAPAPRPLCASVGKHRVVGLTIGFAPVGVGIDVKAASEVKVLIDPPHNLATIDGQPDPAAILVTPPTQPSPAIATQPLYKKWWVWTAVVGGVLIAGGAAAGIAVGTRPSDVSPPTSDFGPFKVLSP